ncbi:MAG: serine/threonine-protein phosphatase [Chloroflexi bacterium]|nr:MAG: serine/threonine-protein phosphatase [Chloroflexota bacterium]
MRFIEQIRRHFVKSSAPAPSTVDEPLFEVADVPEPADSSPAPELEQQDETLLGATSGTLQTGWMTDIGRSRGHNEDSLLVFLGEQESAGAVPLFGLFILADGMGGHQAGELASALACRAVASHLLSQVYLPTLSSLERGATQPSLNEVLIEAIMGANRVVNQTLPGSGTTLTCAMVFGKRLFIGHVGDSRAYLRQANGEIRQLTRDHSVVSKLVEIGQLTPEEAAVHPQRNMLYRAVGQGFSLDVDVQSHPLQPGDQLLLCSDGLWGLLPDEEIWSIVTAAPTLSVACAQLVDAANAAGGRDNISVILVETRRDLA